MDQDERLLEFLYNLPVGFVEFEPDGTLGRMNPMVARTLLPQVGTEGFNNAYALLAPLIPDLPSILCTQNHQSPAARGRKRFVNRRGDALVLEAEVHAVLDHFVAVITDVTAEVEANQRIEAILGGTSAGTWEWNVQTDEVRFNARFAEILGYRLEELSPPSAEKWDALCHVDDLEKSRIVLDAHFRGETPIYEMPCRMRHKDGYWVWIQESGQIMTRTPSGEPEWLFGTHIDITALKHQEEEIAEARDKLEVIASATSVGIMAIGKDRKLEYLSPQFSKLFGYAPDDIGDLDEWIETASADRSSQLALSFAFAPERVRSATMVALPENREIKLRTKGQSIRDALLSVKRVDETIVATFSDISEQKLHEDLARFRAQHDVLTGLPNRLMLSDRLEWATRQARRANWLVCVAFLDLDGFKAINDEHGHEAGDEVLKVISRRLKAALREVDTLARLGGDEFVIVMAELQSRKECIPLLERILGEVRKPVPHLDQQLQVSASLGVTFYAQDSAVDGDQLLRQADKAMYDAKLAGKNRFAVFDQEEDRSIREIHEDLGEISRALRCGEFELLYQPQVNMHTGVVCGLEALLRWRSADGTRREPDSFLPVVYDHGLSVEVGSWVLSRAIEDLAQLLAAGCKIPVCVNIFPRQLIDSSFIGDLHERLARHPEVDPALVQLEIVETAVLNDLEKTRIAMRTCQEMGINCALDDFGTGFSSLSHLRHLPVSTLKIDRSFVGNMLTNHDDLAIVQGTLSLARAFKLHVVAEGVSSVAQGERLLAMGCPVAQGFSIARPMPCKEVPAWLKTWTPPAEWRVKRINMGQ